MCGLVDTITKSVSSQLVNFSFNPRSMFIDPSQNDQIVLIADKKSRSFYASEGLVNCACNNVTILERRWSNTSCNKTSHMSHVSHQPTSILVCYLLEPFVVKTSRVATDTSNEHFRLKKICRFFQFIIVNQS